MKSILITGASTGIGFAAAQAFASDGHQVFAGVRKSKDAEVLLKQNPQIVPLILDVTDQKTIDDSWREVQKLKKFSELILINNAGIAVSGPIESVRMEDYRTQFEVNFFGLIAVTQKFLPLIRESKGRVINISSIAGRVASPFLGPYSSSKFAVEAISDSLRREMIPFGVQVVLIEPGPIQTPIWDKGLGKKDSILKSLGADQIAIYGSAIKSFEAMIEEAVKKAEPVERVVEALQKAVMNKQPCHRYLVGSEAKLNGFLSQIVPSRWVDFFIKKQLLKTK